MAALTAIPNEKPVAATIRDGLGFFLTTLSLAPEKDRDHDLVHHHAAPFKAH